MKHTLDEYRRYYWAANSIRNALKGLIDDTPPQCQANSDRLALDTEVADDLDVYLKAVEAINIDCITSQTVERLREIVDGLGACDDDGATADQWHKVRSMSQAALNELSWADSMSEEQFLLVYYWNQ